MTSRRRFLTESAAAAVALAAVPAQALGAPVWDGPGDGGGHGRHDGDQSGGHGGGVNGATFRDGPGVDHRANGFYPSDVLRDFDYGSVSTLLDGRTLREWEIFASDEEIEIAPGVRFAAWTFGSRIPGPTLRCTEGDRLRVRFVNGSAHPHTMHFHGIHPAEMDGVHRDPRQRVIGRCSPSALALPVDGEHRPTRGAPAETGSVSGHRERRPMREASRPGQGSALPFSVDAPRRTGASDETGSIGRNGERRRERAAA